MAARRPAVSLVARFLAAALASSSASSATHRNILFLLEDDGSMDLGVYGNAHIQTPHLDALAARGVVFDQFHTTVSSCSPSRAALQSGLPSHQNGMYGLQHAAEHFQSFDGVQSVENVLAAHGYATGIIGKYHVWPQASYNFSWGNSPSGPGGCQAGASSACPDTDYNLVSRNITHIKEAAAAFFDYAAAQSQPFFLYVGFGDSHRCGGPVVGEFCEKYGVDPVTNESLIPDWVPFRPAPANITVPFWIQDTPVARQDLAWLYTAKNRMDQGVGLLLGLLEQRGLTNDTLVIFTADNGAPFAAGKTNQYEVATMEPFVAVMPGAPRGLRSQRLSSTLDLLPTWLDWAGVPLPKYKILGTPVNYTGRSLLPTILSGDGQLSDSAAALAAVPWCHSLLRSLPSMQAAAAAAAERLGTPPPSLPDNATKVFGSFQLHEIQEYYPMRTVTAAAQGNGSAAHYRLIYNIANRLLYPVASDLWAAPAMQDLVMRARSGKPTQWYRSIDDYLNVSRPLYELFDLVADPMELRSVAEDPAYGAIFTRLQTDIQAWQYATMDDWTIKYMHE